MNRPLLANILSSFADKGYTAVALLAATALTVRLLPREDYGIMGVVAGYGAMLQILNIALENAILRSHRDYAAQPEKFLLNFLLFNLLKAAPMIVLGGVLAFVLSRLYSQPGFAWAVASLITITVTESLIAPLVIYASAKYQQRLVTRINIVRFSLNLVLLTGLIRWPTLSYLLIKDCAVMSVMAVCWWGVSRRTLGLDFSKVSVRRDADLSFIYRTLTGYSLWVHLVAVCTAFIYKADALFLSFFAPLGTVGNYNVARTSANAANTAPSILGYQNSVALSNASEEQHAFRTTDKFVRLSAYIAVATMVGFIALGTTYLHFMTGQTNVTDMYAYLLCIVAGLVIVKTVASPLVAYINVKGDVRRLLVRVMLPVLVIAAALYYSSASLFGAIGIAASNILIALVWIVLLLKEVRHYGYRLPSWRAFLDDFRDLQPLIAARLKWPGEAGDRR